MNNKNCWTDEMHQFLIENHEKIDYAELAEIMSKRFGRTVSKYAIYGRLRYLRKKCGYQLNKKPSKRKALWTKEMDAVLIDNYLDIHESVIRMFSFLLLFAMVYYELIMDEVYIRIGFVILCILACIIFFLYNFKRKQIALTKIINKVTYESF